VEWSADFGDALYADAVAQPGATPARQWDFAEWGGPGQTDRLLLHNPGAGPAAVLARPRRRSVFGDGLGPPPAPATAITLAPGESRLVDLGALSTALEVGADQAIVAWRLERSHHSYVRSYDDPGFG
jgi:hypothetical protein